MSIEVDIPDSVHAIAERLTDEQQNVLFSILGSLAAHEREVTPPLTGAIARMALHDEVVQNVQEAYGNDIIFPTMDFHFVLETLAAHKEVTIYQGGLVRTGNHPDADPDAVTIPVFKRLTRKERLRRSLQSQIVFGPSRCLDR